MSNDGNVRDVEKPEEVNFENLEPQSKSKLVTFSASSMLNAASGTVMVKLSNAFKEFENPFLYGITLGLINAKCPFNWRKHTRIENCTDESAETFYDYDARQVVICKEQWEAKVDSSSKRSLELEETLSRGMIQAYDHCTTDLSILNREDQLNMRLCSSVRAWALSGSCARDKFGVLERISREEDGFRTCVYNMALEDAKKQLKNDNYEDYMIEEAYEKVFFECIKDSRPFDRIPESVKDVDSSVDAIRFILKK